MMGKYQFRLALAAFAWAAFVVAGSWGPSGTVLAGEGAGKGTEESPDDHGNAAADASGDVAAESSPTSRPAQKGELMNVQCPYTGKDAMADKFVTYADAKKGIYARIYFCCPTCVKDAASGDKKELYEKVFLTKEDGARLKYGDARLVAENDICPVSADPVDGEHFVNYNGVKVALCCSGCEDGFVADPDKFLHNINNDIDAAVAKAKAAPEG